MKEKKQTLLEKAKSVNVSSVYIANPIENDHEFIELLIDYFKGEINVRQCSKAIRFEKGPGQLTHWLSGVIRRAFQSGKIDIVKK